MRSIILPVIAAVLVAGACASAPTAPAAAPATPATGDSDVISTPSSAPEEPAAAQTEATAQLNLPTVTPSPTPPSPAGAEPALPVLAPDQVEIALEAAYEGFELPVFLAEPADGSGRLFVVEKTGTIRVIVDGQIQAEPFLDIGDKITTRGNEQGLLGLAFVPDFAETGHFFVNYTDVSGTTTVERYTVAADNPNRANVSSAFTILTVAQPAPNHNAGMLDFGPDGYLYVPFGDGGAANDRFGNGQNPSTLLGKILRLDVTSDPTQPYLIPADNPFVDASWNGQDVRDEVWAIGLRNPWRTSFDRATGDFWVADVGQNQIEEVNVVPARAAGGLNFGWPIMEGSSCFRAGCDATGLYGPVVDYTHEGGNCSVTGGYVYRGRAFPQWNGIYFYGDYCSGRIWVLAPDSAGGWTNALVEDTDLTLSSFGQDQQGELYALDYRSGVVYHLTLAP
ncbi:MAG: PQQ-dependent sugar dehydrogenase [Caldilineaceae bacterium]|nr:PQQ-dependent sugar dehydrogenase [Caldilineaceae bacterium]